MAVTYTVKRMRDRGIVVSGGSGSITATANVSYQVVVTDPADPTFIGNDVDEMDVRANAAIPIVNRSSYVTVGGKIAPFLLCENRTIQRDAKNPTVFDVKATFKFQSTRGTEESDLDPTDPPLALTDITPIVDRAVVQNERVAYRDKAGEEILTPTGNYFAEPTVEQFATLKITVKQYEATLTDDQIMARMFMMNNATFRSKAAGTWVITDIRPQDTTVTLSGGDTNAVYVEYDIAYTSRANGWKEEKVLVDTHYLEGGKKKRFLDEDVNSFSYGLINADGTKRTLASGPIYATFDVFDEIDYSTFLQVS